jgi:hypothetical protein
LYAEFKEWWEEGYVANQMPGQTRFGAEAKRKFKWAKASRVVYAVRLLADEEREGGKVGGDSPVQPRAHAQVQDSLRKVPPTFPRTTR